jgi:hypothetical protein
VTSLNPYVIGKLSCYTNSMIPSYSSIYYELSAAQNVYDCDGKRVEFNPDVAIDPTNGNIYSNRKLSRKDFCDSSFTITVRKDDFYKTSTQSLIN